KKRLTFMLAGSIIVILNETLLT
ncbi:uncharacterized protein METZ01_LOCUS85333, partial [marine metagenome]